MCGTLNWATTMRAGDDNDPMKAQHYQDAREFAGVVGAQLHLDVPRNQLILSVLETAAEQPDKYPEYHGWTVTRDGEPVAIASCTPPYNYIVGDVADGDAMDALVDVMAASGVSAPGVLGNRPSIDAFASRWAGAVGVVPEVEMGQGVFTLDEVADLDLTAGSMREATVADKDVILGWTVAFWDEAVEKEPIVDPEKGVDERLNPDKPQGMSLWEVDGQVVCMSGYSPPVANSIRIGPVYTPPELRGNGYATALVTMQSQAYLDQGRDRCMLFTDLANPTSNAIYKRIGYYQVAESIVYRFVDS